MSAATALSTPPPDVFRALSDPTRRRILDALREGPRTTGKLCQDFEMSRFGVMKHLTVLVDAGVVLVERRGRERWNYLNAAPIQEIYRRWIRSFEAEAADRLCSCRASRTVTAAAPTATS